MAIEVIMPQLGADMTEGKLVRWLKREGEPVSTGEPIAEIETDKATVQLESPAAGVLSGISVEAGAVVPVGRILAYVTAAGESVPVAPPGAAAERAPVPRPSGLPARPAVAARIENRLRVSPVARRIAEASGMDLAGILGTGPEGRILRQDVEAAVAAAKTAALPGGLAPAAAPAAAHVSSSTGGPATPRPLSKMRAAIARKMVLSKTTAPHYYLTIDADMTAAMEFRRRLNEIADESARATVNDLVIKACSLALSRHPAFNSAWGGGGIVFHEAIHINVGIALESGLIAPALLDCGTKSLGEIAAAAKSLADRAKKGALTPAEYTEGTFTITNLGPFGVETLIGIINPPQAAILGIGAAIRKPVADDRDSITVRTIMKLALSADHRITDGAEGAVFLKDIKNFLELPEAMAL